MTPGVHNLPIRYRSMQGIRYLDHCDVFWKSTDVFCSDRQVPASFNDSAAMETACGAG
jgi:hypothetical protein